MEEDVKRNGTSEFIGVHSIDLGGPMRVLSTTNLFLLALVLIPLALTAQDSGRTFPVPVGAFADVAPGPVSLRLPQSSGEKSPALAGLLNAFVLPGIGNLYAGNSGHGLRHLALTVVGGAVAFLGMHKVNSTGDGEAWAVAGAVVLSGNWVWSIFSGIEDARAAGRPGSSNGGVASILQPQLVPLGVPSVLGDPPGVTKHRLCLQLIRVAF